MNLNLLFKDINFIMVRDRISRNLNRKYENAKISSVKKTETSIDITYVILFDLPVGVWETKCQLIKADFSVVILSDIEIEKRVVIQDLPPLNVTKEKPRPNLTEIIPEEVVEDHPGKSNLTNKLAVVVSLKN